MIPDGDTICFQCSTARSRFTSRTRPRVRVGKRCACDVDRPHLRVDLVRRRLRAPACSDACGGGRHPQELRELRDGAYTGRSSSTFCSGKAGRPVFQARVKKDHPVPLLLVRSQRGREVAVGGIGRIAVDGRSSASPSVTHVPSAASPSSTPHAPSTAESRSGEKGSVSPEAIRRLSSDLRKRVAGAT